VSGDFEEDAHMTFVGLAVVFVGFLISFVSLGVTDSVGARMGMVIAGIVVSLFGIMGVLTPAYQKKWIGKR
jgi:cytochrome c biogenesis protein CcdA